MRCKRVEGREAEAHSAPIRLFGLLLHYSLPRTEALPHGAAYGDFVYAVPTPEIWRTCPTFAMSLGPGRCSLELAWTKSESCGTRTN